MIFELKYHCPAPPIFWVPPTYAYTRWDRASNLLCVVIEVDERKILLGRDHARRRHWSRFLPHKCWRAIWELNTDCLYEELLTLKQFSWSFSPEMTVRFWDNSETIHYTHAYTDILWDQQCLETVWNSGGSRGRAEGAAIPP